MKVIKEGHTYELEGFENPDNSQKVQFIEKEPKQEGSTESVIISDGTTNEEVLKMLIDRMYYLQSKFPCRENVIVISNLEVSLTQLEKRTKDRKERGVEGKQIP